MDICRGSRGFSAPLTLEFMERLAGLLGRDPERAAQVEAEGLIQHVYTTRVSTLGIAHPDTAHALSGLVPILVALNKSEAAHILISKQVRGCSGLSAQPVRCSRRAKFLKSIIARLWSPFTLLKHPVCIPLLCAPAELHFASAVFPSHVCSLLRMFFFFPPLPRCKPAAAARSSSVPCLRC